MPLAILQELPQFLDSAAELIIMMAAASAAKAVSFIKYYLIVVWGLLSLEYSEETTMVANIQERNGVEEYL